MKVPHSTRFKKLLACILSVVMVGMIMFSIAPTNVMADSTYGDFTYVVLSDNTIEITGYNGTSKNVTIPSTIAGRRVTVIGQGAFEVQKINNEWWRISSVSIPNTVTTIGHHAFEGSDLTTITIPNSVTYIDGMAFSDSSSLTSVIIPNSVTYIGDHAFSGCESLSQVSIPNSVTYIGEYAFYGCDSLTSINIPSGVTKIENGTFWSCDSLSQITIPSNVTSIGSQAFQDTGLTSITIPNSVTKIGSIAFALCTSLESVTLPDGITEIHNNTFFGCTSLESIAIPDSVTLIYDSAFSGCTSLESITIPDSVTSISNEAFSNCTSLESIIIPDSVTSIHSSAFEGCDNLTINCYENTAAHHHAIDYGFNCILMPRPSTPTPTPTATPTPRPTSTPSQGNSTIPPATGNTVNRQEAQNFATRCYELVLDRTPDATGLNNWTNSLVNNQNTGAHMAYGFFFSQEYINSNTSNEEFVTTLYNVFLDRAPDQGGLNDWVGQLEAGASREQVFAGVANSREFFGLCNGYGITAGHYVQGLDNTQQQNVNAFVARLYSMCLGRNGDYAGQESWVRQLINHENSGAGVGYGFFFSQEFINRNLTNEEYVATLYRVFLGREPDQAGFNSWVSQLNNGADRLSIFRGFAHSQEYTNICNSYGIERGSV